MNQAPAGGPRGSPAGASSWPAPTPVRG